MASFSPPRVLVVDDDQRFAMAVTALLEAAGMVVVGRAEDGAAALALAEQLRPDVVTMDIDMPVMDGVEATRRLRASQPMLPVILVTGSESSERVQETLSIGGIVHVPKARTSDLLPDAIHAALGVRA